MDQYRELLSCRLIVVYKLSDFVTRVERARFIPLEYT